jgi:PAS domain S-box-containing protein
VVHAVLSGEADIGTVRTDTLERMAAAGEIRLDAIRVIPAGAAPGSRTTFPYLLSTRLYPEWPFARLSDTTEDLAREVTVALLSMPVDSPAAIAAQSGGWGVCLNYASVHDCLRELRMPPYEHYGQMSWQDICREHWKGLGADFLAAFHDLTESRKAEDALRESEEKYRTVANFNYDWEYWTGPDQHFIYCSPSCERITGYRAEDFEKDPDLLKNITHPDDRTQSIFHIDDFPGSGPESHEQEVRIITRSGEVRWIAHACCIVRGSDGKFLGRRASNRNITDKKRAEEKICSLSQLLLQSKEKERLLISCELHDSIAQNLSVLKINSDMIYNDPAMTSPGLRENLTASTGLLMQTIAAVRNPMKGTRILIKIPIQ